jgi:hypothetical protein
VAHYGSNTGAKLQMGASTASTLPAHGSDTFTDMPLLESVQPPSNEIQIATFNVHNQVAPLTLGGKLSNQTVEAVIAVDWAVTQVSDAYADSVFAGGRRRNWKIQYPSGRVIHFQGFITKWTEDAMEASEEVVEHRASISIAITLQPVVITP